MYPNTWFDEEKKYNKILFIPDKFVNLQKELDKICFCSPITPQGMLIFGAITSAYAIKKSRCK